MVLTKVVNARCPFESDSINIIDHNSMTLSKMNARIEHNFKIVKLDLII